MTIEIRPRNTVRGRPRTGDGFTCDRCGREAGKPRVRWPDGKICGTCFHAAVRTYGYCAACGFERMLPGQVGDSAVCVDCAGIATDFHCRSCGTEAEHYRRGICARCALRDDLTSLLLDNPADPAAMNTLVGIFCAVDRPESIHTWKRSAKVREPLRQLATGQIPMTHEGLDSVGDDRRTMHLRGILEHHQLIPPRDRYLALFEDWIAAKMTAIDDGSVRRYAEQFATWHHLKRVRAIAAAGKPTRGPVHASKQDITETIKFLTWLHDTRSRTAATCNQLDVDEWTATGPTTRQVIRTFFVWAKTIRINRTVTIAHRSPAPTITFTQDERLRWIRELLTGSSESLPYRVAGILLLLYAQPMVKIAALRTDHLTTDTDGLCITLGAEPAPVPEPFAVLLRRHIQSRTTQLTGTDTGWLFPSIRTGRHLHPNTMMDRIRSLGINLLGARTTSLRTLVTQVPPPLAAEMLGYSYSVAHRHAELAAQPWAQYSAQRK
ncbi:MULTISPECIES: recombinase XerD [unclassified Rhodococcus (in: high G+C Gram-positive bacteria)]|uniref:recombinase XerD n=1 Tax=unclassified Rhodococcus (in: high G+C Gram-positive bacteria) TaxID=192944 RepID=UPI0015953ABE|nr:MULTISPECIES: recombinase XerD [unclassified Rhodococcus (in: high G+C Gram-positive bacteria)]